MKTLAIALATALVAGAGVYAWRSAELADRQSRLLDAAMAQTEAELAVERLRTELKDASSLVETLRGQVVDMEERLRDGAPALSTEPDGRYFGFIESIDVDRQPPVVVIDFAEFLVGEEAQEAAEEAGVVEPGDPVPNDYFIRNENPKLRSLALARGARIVVSTWDKHNIPDPKTVTLEMFEGAWTDDREWVSRVTSSPYWVTSRNGVLVKVEEQYLP